MSMSNYPPGVTGHEPAITGDYAVWDDPHAPWYAYISAEGNVCLTNMFVTGETPNIPMASWERAEASVEIMNRAVAKCRYDKTVRNPVCKICGELAPWICTGCDRDVDDHPWDEDTYGREYQRCPTDDEEV